MTTPSRKIYAERGLQERFLRQSVTHESDDCLIWPWSKDQKGYAKVSLKGDRFVRAGRFICRLAHGEPPSERSHAAHTCRNPACINPRHLRWATASENEQDKVEHDTAVRGEKHYKTSLTAEQVMDAYNSAETAAVVAARLQTTPKTVANIRQGVSWRWLTKHRLIRPSRT